MPSKGNVSLNQSELLLAKDNASTNKAHYVSSQRPSLLTTQPHPWHCILQDADSFSVDGNHNRAILQVGEQDLDQVHTFGHLPTKEHRAVVWLRAASLEVIMHDVHGRRGCGLGARRWG